MASRPTFSAKEVTELVLTSLLESDGELDIPEDPKFSSYFCERRGSREQ